jgi:hypothetical protein
MMELVSFTVFIVIESGIVERWLCVESSNLSLGTKKIRI